MMKRMLGRERFSSLDPNVGKRQVMTSQHEQIASFDTEQKFMLIAKVTENGFVNPST